MALLADLNANSFHGTKVPRQTLVGPLMGSPGAGRKQRFVVAYKRVSFFHNLDAGLGSALVSTFRKSFSHSFWCSGCFLCMVHSCGTGQQLYILFFWIPGDLLAGAGSFLGVMWCLFSCFFGVCYDLMFEVDILFAFEFYYPVCILVQLSLIAYS